MHQVELASGAKAQAAQNRQCEHHPWTLCWNRKVSTTAGNVSHFLLAVTLKDKPDKASVEALTSKARSTSTFLIELPNPLRDCGVVAIDVALNVAVSISIDLLVHVQSGVAPNAIGAGFRRIFCIRVHQVLLVEGVFHAISFPTATAGRRLCLRGVCGLAITSTSALGANMRDWATRAGLYFGGDWGFTAEPASAWPVGVCGVAGGGVPGVVIADESVFDSWRSQPVTSTAMLAVISMPIARVLVLKFISTAPCLNADVIAA